MPVAERDRHVRQRRHALVRAARCTSRSSFAFDRVKALAAEAPRVEGEAAVQGACSTATCKALADAGETGLRRDLIAATHAGMTTEEFETIVTDWLATAKHPRFKRPYTECVYQPMLEAAGVPAGQRVQDVHRLRRRRSSSCGRGPRRCTASRPSRSSAARIKTKYEMRDGKPVLVKLPRDRLHRRQGRQAGRHQAVHRPPAGHGVRQLRRRLRDARVDHGRAGAAVRPDRPPHRRRPRVRLRPQVARRPARQGARRGAEARLDRRRA